MDLRDAAAYHALVLNAEGAALATQKNYLHYWGRLIDYCDEAGIGVGLNLFTPDLIRSAANWYRGTADPNASRNGVVAVRQFVQRMNTAAGFLEREGIISELQYRHVKPPKVGKLLRTPFTQIEVTAMWGACSRTQNPERDEAVLLLLLDTGMRIGEANSLTLDRVDLAQHRVIISPENKGKAERIVPVGTGDRRDGGRTLNALRKYLAVRPGNRFDHDRFFLSGDGRPMRAVGLSHVIKHLGKLAGVENPIPHRLRHLFCTMYLTLNPGDEMGLRRIVGHLSKEVTEDYVHFSQSTLADRAGRASLADLWLGAGRPTLPVSVRTFRGTAPAGQLVPRPTGTDPIDRPHRSRRSR